VSDYIAVAAPEATKLSISSAKGFSLLGYSNRRQDFTNITVLWISATGEVTIFLLNTALLHAFQIYSPQRTYA
jgi:hypothetical protein